MAAKTAGAKTSKAGVKSPVKRFRSLDVDRELLQAAMNQR